MNSPDGYASLQIDEHWKRMEKSPSTQQSESESFIPLVKAVSKEGGQILAHVNFQISPEGVMSVNDLHNAHLKFDV
jgi:hypothetical protein